MKSFNTSIKINAPAEKVWNILTDASNWTQWNTTIEKIDGSIALGNKVTVVTKASPDQAFPLKVTKFVPYRSMVWTGGMPLGLFTGKRTYSVNQINESSSEFSMNEVFTGLMAPLFTRSIPDLQPSFDEFANCLKYHSESTAT
jgi:hypothetical protein